MIRYCPQPINLDMALCMAIGNNAMEYNTEQDRIDSKITATTNIRRESEVQSRLPASSRGMTKPEVQEVTTLIHGEYAMG